MPTVLQPDDLRPGLILAVHTYETTRRAAESLLFEGQPFRVLSVSLPFLTVSGLHRDGSWSPPIIFDIRVCTITRLSRSYIRSLRNALPTSRPLPRGTPIAYERRLQGGLGDNPPPTSPW